MKDPMPMRRANRRARHRETHRSGRAGWLRAAVLGSDDAIVSTASLMIGVAAASASMFGMESFEIGARVGYGLEGVLPEEVLAFLGPHDVQAVPGIGPATSAVLRDMGINRVEQLIHQPAAFLRRVFGSGISALVEALREGCDTPEESGEAFPRALPLGYVGGSEANPFGGKNGGQGSGPPHDGMEPPSASRPKSIGHETTFERDEIDPEVARTAMEEAGRKNDVGKARDVEGPERSIVSLDAHRVNAGARPAAASRDQRLLFPPQLPCCGHSFGQPLADSQRPEKRYKQHLSGRL